MLGLGEYDSPGASGDGESPVDADIVEDEPVVPNALRLSIVDYDNEIEDKPEEPIPGGGISLDDDALHRATPRRVGVNGVQISVVKKVTGTSAPMATAPSAIGESEQAPTAAELDMDRPAFVTPDSPVGEIDAKLAEKFKQLVSKSREGYCVNEHIRMAKSFRNPDILEKLVSFFDVRECGTNYPSSLYDPNELSKEEHYDKLEDVRRRWEEKQARKSGEKVTFSSAGTLDPAKVTAAAASVKTAAAAAAEVAAANLANKGPRKSKWDNNSGTGEPVAKKQQS
mmetsp:Transcript_22670/g.37469  ORF Transcript_22670/g.37469 Transcript_22670/m.37469 type:complete len:283 (-) Transcript_22670:225-1073(-)|eukprot:CAMPEP_0119326820 /NCGR_PEP_ID=MMETSP1333-20130426/69374_1 /TAXON_ID=418940 /ORGANISM="Scyphosphaera apsteinii, Strain RCC1455" /LENGTH=282 /DNA_ID=CAMNT_0007335239 /DNA_START=12 /DNA_END=860 /DNA_ORIENTATION=-